MKKFFKNLVSVLVVVFTIILIYGSLGGNISFLFGNEKNSPSSNSRGYDDGYTDGRAEGYEEGYREGYDNGYENGCDEGGADRFSEGYDYGYRDALWLSWNEISRNIQEEWGYDVEYAVKIARNYAEGEPITEEELCDAIWAIRDYFQELSDIMLADDE